MANSYPRRDQARGIWKINDITKNIKEDGTYPQTAGQLGLFAGGGTPSEVNTIQSVIPATAGNAVDFGDLRRTEGNFGGFGNFTRAIFGGGEPATNILEYVHFASLGNAADFGDLSVARGAVKGNANDTRGLMAGGEEPSLSNVIDFVTISTLGNATDFGNLTVSRSMLATGETSSPSRALYAGGNEPAMSNVIDFVQYSTTANAVDFGNLTVGRGSGFAASASATRAIYMGGGNPDATTNVIDYVEIGSLGNAIDFGDLTQSRTRSAGVGNSLRGMCGGGALEPNIYDIIDFVTITTRANATDFGDLLTATTLLTSASNGHGGLEEFLPRSPELYSPTGTVVPNGFGQGDIGVYNGGEAPGSTNVIEFIQISTIGGSQDFGDLTSANAIGGAVSNSTRYVTIGDNTDTLDTHYLEFKTKGNTAFFGDLTVRGWAGAGGSNSTRGINYGRANPATSGTANETIDYITTATIGNWTDFGNCNVASYFNGGTNSSTRMVKCGGITEGPNTITDSMEYVTIGSTGNGTDFGDLVASNGGFSCGNVSNGTRGIFGGGSVNPANNTNTNVIQYITIASTSNTTDFGDLTVARRYSGSSCNSTRGVWAGGENPSNSNTMDYVTIASTGNAIDYGDLAINVSRHGGASNGHGGLS